MRTKSDERRQAILDVATQIFKDIGYERASMAAIAARGRVKSHALQLLPSKEELHATAMTDAVCEHGEAVCEMLDTQNRDVAAVLKCFGVAYIGLLVHSDVLALVRAGVAAGAQGKLGAALYAMGPRRGYEEMTAYFAGLSPIAGCTCPIRHRPRATSRACSNRAGRTQPLWRAHGG
jgi:hypothetical protein